MTADGERLLYVHDLGLVDYDEAWAFQRLVAKARIDGKHGAGALKVFGGVDARRGRDAASLGGTPCRPGDSFRRF